MTKMDKLNLKLVTVKEQFKSKNVKLKQGFVNWTLKLCWNVYNFQATSRNFGIILFSVFL